MTIFEELKRRGLLAQLTDEEEIKELINNGKATFYIGFDPTADSLHVGHFMALCLMKRLQQAGNRPIALLGGGTGMIGDPTGRSDMRTMMTKETIQHNIECFKEQMSKFIDFSDGKALMVNNAEWLLDLNYIDFLREIGPHFSVNNMLRAECYKQRMEKGLSFLEFNYMLMQSYDFLELFQRYGCNMQFGGDDQWSNMLGGTELIRKKLGKDAYAMTITLLLNSEGKKMGKTQKGAVWLDAKKTSPYEFFQYWRNVDDADVIKCLKLLTFIDIEEIEKMESWEGAELNKAKEILAFELTKMIHGEEEAKKALDAAKGLFAGGSTENIPTTELTDDDFLDGKIDAHGKDDRSHTCLHSLQNHCHIHIVGNEVVDERDSSQDDHRRKDRAQHRGYHPYDAEHLPSDKDGHIDGNSPGGGLRQGNQIQHLGLVNPSKLIRELLLDEGRYDKTTAESECAYVEHA